MLDLQHLLYDKRDVPIAGIGEYGNMKYYAAMMNERLKYLRKESRITQNQLAFTPDEVSECVVHEMEKNIDQMLCKVLQQLQDTFDAYYEDKSQDIEINRTVVEQLSPKDPFGGNI